MTLEQAQRAEPFAAARRIRLENWHWPLLAGLVACLLTQLAPGELIADGDTHLHIAMGRWILAHHAIPFRDAFSFTFPGQEWVPHEWGGELILAAAYGALGWGGVIAVTELALFASVAILTRFLLRYLVPRRAAIAASIAFTVAEPHILARPHLLAFPVMVLWMSSIVAARDEGRPPSLKLLPVMILWANLHAGFMIGLAFAGFLALEALIDARPGERIAVARRWGVFLALAGLSSLVSPNGIDVYVMTLKLVQMGSAMSMISEWQAADFSGYQPIEIWLVAFLLVALSAGLRLKMTRTLMLLLLLHLTLTHVRNVELLGFISPLLIAAPLAAQLRILEGTRDAFARDAAPTWRARAAAAAFIVFAFFATAALYNRAGFRPSESVGPVSALAAARAQGLTGPVLNNYNFGGYLIFSGVPVFIDGRADLFGDEFIRSYMLTQHGQNEQGLPKLLERYAIQWTIFPPGSDVVPQLDRLAGWERAYTDKFAVIHRRMVTPS